MRTFVLRRLATTVPVVVLVSIIAFSVVQILPGDVALAVLGEERAGDTEAYEALQRQMALDRPVAVRYLSWVGSALTGDLGSSYRTGEPVAAALGRRLGPTLQLAGTALLIAIAVGLPMGMLSALRPGSALDSLGTLLALAGVAIPNFWLGILLIYAFSIGLGWIPPSGYVSPFEDLAQSLRLMFMPSLALGTALGAVVLRQTRSALLEVLSEDYIRTARSKGLAGRRVVTKHALRISLIPVLTVVGMQIGRLFGGTVTIELIFSIPGMGRLAVDSIHFRDFQMLQGIMLVMALAVLLANLLADISYALLDPRIQYS